MQKASKVTVHVGRISDMGRCFTNAWNRAASGKQVNETHITFLDLQTMLETLSLRRLELLKYAHQHGAQNVKRLATALDRDYKNVHQDVAVLESAGLLLRDGRKLLAMERIKRQCIFDGVVVTHGCIMLAACHQICEALRIKVRNLYLIAAIFSVKEQAWQRSRNVVGRPVRSRLRRYYSMRGLTPYKNLGC